MKPTTASTPDGGWRFEWLAVGPGIAMDVRPTHGRDGTEAEVTVYGLEGEVWRQAIAPTRVDLAAPYSRSALARALLGRRMGTGIDWASMVEQAAMLTLRAMRGGTAETPRTFRAAELLTRDLPAPREIVPGILTEGLWILGARPKVGKSWFMLNTLIAIAAGGRALGQLAVEPGDGLYLALEDSEIRLQTRLTKALNGEACPERLHYTTEWSRLDAGGLEGLAAWLREHPATRLIVVDTLQKARGRSSRQGNGRLFEEDYEALEGLAQLARTAHVCIVVVMHLRKGGAEDPLEALSGTMGSSAAADGILVLERARRGTQGQLHVVGRDLPADRLLSLTWDEALAQWNLAGEAEDVQQTSHRAAILAWLKDADDAQSARDIADVCGVPYPSVRRLLADLAREGVVTRPTRGLYALTVAGRDDRGGAENDRAGDRAIMSDGTEVASRSQKMIARSSDHRTQKDDRAIISEANSALPDHGNDRMIARSHFAHSPLREGVGCPQCGGRLRSDRTCERCQIRLCTNCCAETGSILRRLCVRCGMGRGP